MLLKVCQFSLNMSFHVISRVKEVLNQINFSNFHDQQRKIMMQTYGQLMIAAQREMFG